MAKLHGSSGWRAPRPVLLGACAVVVSLLGGCVGEGAVGDGPAQSGGRGETAGISIPSWPAPSDVADRVAAAGLDLGPMGMAEHYHPQLAVYIGDQQVPVPANIGVDPATGAMSSLHTHSPDGILHIEADVQGEMFTLGQFFTEWGVDLTARQIGAVRAKPGEAVAVTVNGHSYNGDPAALRLEQNQEIVVRLG